MMDIDRMKWKFHFEECIAVLTMLYKKNGAVSNVGSARTLLVVIQFVRNEK